MRSVDNFQHLLGIVPITVNGIILCQGNLTLMTDDLPTVIRHFGNQKKYFLFIYEMSLDKQKSFKRLFTAPEKLICIPAWKPNET